MFIKPFHPMGYVGYAGSWSIWWAVSIGCNLWTPGPDLACQDVVMESQVHRMWKQFHSHIPSRSPRRRIYEPEARAGLNPEPISLVSIYWNHIMFAHDLCHSQIEYFSNSIDLNRKDRASLLRRNGYEGRERYHKSSIFNRQYSIPACPGWVIFPR